MKGFSNKQKMEELQKIFKKSETTKQLPICCTSKRHGHLQEKRRKLKKN